jgi:hypothetical protein
MGDFKVWWRRDFKTTFLYKMAGNGLDRAYLGKKWKEGATQATQSEKCEKSDLVVLN